MLVHWPPAGVPVADVMAQMVALREAGLARSIGVSNFTPRMLREAAPAGIVTNQVEFHCLIDQSALKAEADRLGVRLTAYSPVAKGRVFDALPVRAAAERLGRTPAQVALRWIVQQGVAAIPKSSRREGLAENLGALDFALPPEDMAAIGALTAANRRFVTPSWAPDWTA
jgi:2,5-diketo-D-gluconate reductase B